MKTPGRNGGFFLQSLRARTWENHYHKNKTQDVIYEDRETPEAAGTISVLELVRRGSSWSIIIPEILLGCIWWSVVLAYPSILLHSSIVEKKPYGFELLALCYSSPLIVTRFPAVKKFIANPTGLLLSRICLSVVLLGCHLTSSFVRLLLTSVGNTFAPLVLSRLWYTSDPLDRSRKIYLHMLGYLLLLVLRVYWLTVDPLYSSVVMNYLAIVTCVASSIHLHHVDRPCPPANDDNQSWKRRESLGNRRTLTLRSIAIGVAFGALLFLTSWLFGESSVVGILIRTQPSSVPIPVLEGILIMIALATGFAVLSEKKNLTSHPVWCVVGLGSGLAFYHQSFAGGCMLAIFIMSLWPHLLDLFPFHSSALVLTVGMGTYFMLTSASAIATGHDVIPGVSMLLDGEPAILLLCSIALVVAGVQNHWIINNSPSVVVKPHRRKSSRHGSQISFFGSAWRKLSTIDEESSSEGFSENDDAFEDEITTDNHRVEYDVSTLKDEEGERFLSLVQKVTLVLLLMTVMGHMMQANTIPAPPTKQANHRQLTVTAWSANFGYTTNGILDLQRTALILNATRADVIGVIDCDSFYPFFGSHNMMGWMATTLDMFLHWTDVQSTGLGVLSHHHIVNYSHQLLDTKEGLHVAVTVTINVSGHLVDYSLVKPRHHRHHRDHTINCSQLHLQNLSETVNTSHHSSAIMVHFTFCNYSSFVSNGWKHIINSSSEGWTAHILYRNLIRSSYVNTGDLVMGRFIISEHDNESDNDEVYDDDKQQFEFYWTKFLERYYTDTEHSILKYFTQT